MYNSHFNFEFTNFELIKRIEINDDIFVDTNLIHIHILLIYLFTCPGIKNYSFTKYIFKFQEILHFLFYKRGIGFVCRALILFDPILMI